MHCPKYLQPFWRAWLAFSHALGRVMSFVIHTVLWLVFFSVYGIMLKVLYLFQSKKEPKTYWVDPLPDVPDGIGVQFLGVPEHVQRAIDSFVEQRAPMFHPD